MAAGGGVQEDVKNLADTGMNSGLETVNPNLLQLMKVGRSCVATQKP